MSETVEYNGRLPVQRHLAIGEISCAPTFLQNNGKCRAGQAHKPGFVVGRQDPNKLDNLENRVTGHNIPISQACQERVDGKPGCDADEALDVRDALEQFVDEPMLELLVNDSVEAEPQLDVDDRREAIEGNDHEE
jgi:hypothetical protein